MSPRHAQTQAPSQRSNCTHAWLCRSGRQAVFGSTDEGTPKLQSKRWPLAQIGCTDNMDTGAWPKPRRQRVPEHDLLHEHADKGPRRENCPQVTGSATSSAWATACFIEGEQKLRSLHVIFAEFLTCECVRRRPCWNRLFTCAHCMPPQRCTRKIAVPFMVLRLAARTTA